MSGFNDFGSFLTDGAEGLSQKTMNVFSHSYNQNLNEMFGRLHESRKTDEKAEYYNPNSYQRAAFRTKEQQQRFIEAMKQQNISIVAPDVKINGQYLAEIPQYVYTNTIENNDELVQENQQSEKITAQEIIDDYQERTFETVLLPEEPQYERRPTEAGQQISPYRYITNNMDVFGSIVDRLVSAGYQLDKFGADSNSDIWYSKPDAETGAAKPTVNAGMSKKAVVLNGDTVVIDGEVVYGDVREDVLRMHSKRISRADSILNNDDILTDLLHHSVTGKETKKIKLIEGNAEAIRNSVYRQEYVVSGTGKGRGYISNVKEVSYGGVLDKFTQELNTDAIAMAHISFDNDEIEIIYGLNTLSLSESEKFLIDRLYLGGAGTTERITLQERQALSDILSEQARQTGSNYNKRLDLLQKQIDVLEARNTEHLSAEERKSLADMRKRYTELSEIHGSVLAELTSVQEAKRHLESNKEHLLPNEAERLDRLNERYEYLRNELEEFSSLSAEISQLEAKQSEREKMSLSNDEKTELAELYKQYKELENERDRVLENIGNLRRKAGITENARLIKSIENDFGIIINAANPLTRERLIEINEEFIIRAERAGFQFVRSDIKSEFSGRNVMRFDIEALKNLKSKQLEQLGISSDTRDMLVELNEKYAFGTSTSLFSKTQTGFNSGMQLISRANSDDAELQAVFSDFETMSRGVSYAKKSVETIRRLGNIRISDIRNMKKTGWQGVREAYNKPVETRKGKKKPPKKEKATPIDEELNRKYIASQKKKLEKATRKENSLTAKGKNAVNGLKKSISESALGKAVAMLKKAATKLLMKLLLYLGAAAAFLGTALVIIVLIMSCIQALLNINPQTIISNMLAPDTYEDTITFKLYDYLQDMENDWLEHQIKNTSGIYENRTEMRFGADYETLLMYVGSTRASRKSDNMFTNGSDIYINPFHNAVGFSLSGENSRYLTAVTSFDGKHNIGISANTNVYSKRNTDGISYDEGAYLGYTSIESGHTCNIKDIISMVDVMYTEGQSDGELNSILGISPAQMSWNNACNKVSRFCSWVGKKISGFFGGEEPPSFSAFMSDTDTVSYGTIRAYATYLFNLSHQQEINFKVEYYPVDEDYGIIDSTDYIEYQQKASEHDVCIDPVTNSFPLYWNIDHVSPYIEKDGIKYPLNDHDTGNDIVLDMATDMISTDDVCLKSSMGSDIATLEFIKNNDCWNAVSEYTEGVSKSASNGNTGGYNNTGWYTTEDEAKTDIYNKLISEKDNIILPDDSYQLATGRETFTYVHSEKRNFGFDDISYTINSQKMWDGTYDRGQWYWTGVNGNSGGGFTSDSTDYETWYIIVYQGEITDFDDAVRNGKSTDEWISENGSNIKRTIYTDNTIGGCDWSEQKENGKWDYNYYDHINDYTWKKIEDCEYDDNIIVVPDCYPVKHKIDVYNGFGSVDMYETKTTTYSHECKEHDFRYCGGHVCISSQGIVFSATNEQLIMTGILDKNNPLAEGFDMKANGYDTLKGKYNTGKSYDKTTILTAVQSSGGLNPLSDPQGSFSGMQGINFNFTSPDVWNEGFAVDGENDPDKITIDNYHLMRDIFDVDCMVKKGLDTLPFRASEWYKYEGWTADNMTLALNRMAMDWYELYGFDIPFEIGGRINTADTSGYTLSQDDIKVILEALKSKYGADFTENRAEAIEYTLNWVGRGHYSEQHKEHNFLSKGCEGLKIDIIHDDGTEETISYDGNCTAGNDIGFVNYIYSIFKSDDIYGISTEKINGAYHTPSNDFSNLRPMDVIVHTEGAYENELSLNTDVWKDYNGYSAVIYIGTVDEEIELASGQKIEADVPIIVDLNSINGRGNIYLHTEMPVNADDYSGDIVYWWLTELDTHTKFKSFE